MKVLLACGGGMSSSILAENLIAEAKKNGNNDFIMEATGTEEVGLKMQQEEWDALLLAPQVSFRKAHLQKEADARNIPLIPIEGILYTPMGVPDLYKLIQKEVL
ncbi:PTS diacetylchitobiose transporter subunit IIB [Melissococcus plutonius]|uniref:PTS system, diacetylchitobiose-specific IIB component n=2 Tax=Melissococcus plutonius TaxID=33970 RepID=F3YB65_MELPT|nr:PTS diacetylchitobiose transporter subunit IIB [Melissococcus plutonius]BAL61909.1 PTS system diacetylchitobiose-specific transporter subunit IIB [Melissococcus plutonius DAT561]AIM25846.1 PTS system diacetylchitobiose-specific transporter subunit IIB [Melissococcus plutonius S1]KMT25420.1 PTS system diacetylchitobiose-specific transporter subunit IIB [Melissococcus plutonius]KMT25460.1 PTS system diacetylchitobiose-specific transporter subunit IIB [Melissococcus plutonius]KMT26324.1 PTS sy